ISGTFSRLRARPRRGALPRFVRQRRHMAVRWIRHEPGAAVVRKHVLEPVNRAPELGAVAVGLDPLLASVVPQLLELGLRDVLDTTSLELRRPLEGDQAFVVVRVHPCDIRIAPHGLRRDVRLDRFLCWRRRLRRSKTGARTYQHNSSYYSWNPHGEPHS